MQLLSKSSRVSAKLMLGELRTGSPMEHLWSRSSYLLQFSLTASVTKIIFLLALKYWDLGCTVSPHGLIWQRAYSSKSQTEKRVWFTEENNNVVPQFDSHYVTGNICRLDAKERQNSHIVMCRYNLQMFKMRFYK